MSTRNNGHAEKSLEAALEAEGFDAWATISSTHPDFVDFARRILREKEERETPCVWTLDGVGEGWYLGCNHREWQQSRGNFCFGCGHPVQVKQNEEE